MGKPNRTSKTQASPPSVMFLIRSLDRGGAERQLVTLVTGLKDLGWPVSVACFYMSGPLVQDLMQHGVPIHPLDKRSRWDVLGFVLRFIRLVRKEKPMILHGYLPMANLVVLLSRLVRYKTKVVWGVRASELDFSQYDWIARADFAAQCLLSRMPDRIISNSHAGLKYHVRRGFPRSRICVIPNGIDTRRFCFSPGERRELRRAWKISDGVPLIGLVGRIDPIKGHKDFLRVVKRLSIEHPAWRFVCVGEGKTDYVKTLKQQTKGMGLYSKVAWVGAMDRMIAVYSALDVLISCSYGEGFSNVVAEAMACERPCAVTRAGDSAWIVGATGVVVEPGDVEGLAQGLELLVSGIGKEGDKVGRRTRDRIVKNFSVDAMVNRTVSELDALNAERRPARKAPEF